MSFDVVLKFQVLTIPDLQIQSSDYSCTRLEFTRLYWGNAEYDAVLCTLSLSVILLFLLICSVYMC